jgi:hypothetical protein
MEALVPAVLIIVVGLYVRSRARRFLRARGGLARMGGRAVGAARRARRQKLQGIQGRLETLGLPVEAVRERLTEEQRSDALEEFLPEETFVESVPPPVPHFDPDADPEPDPEPLDAAPPEPVEAAPVSAIDPLDLARDLFEGRAGFEATERFDAQMEGTRVRWTGVIERMQRARELAGGRDQIEITARVPESASALGRDVRWTCVLPPDEGVSLDGAAGRRIEVEGTLATCDPYMWHFTLVEGRALI